MSTETAPQPVEAPPDDADSLRHNTCCNPDRAMCGLDVSRGTDVSYEEDRADNCVVCEETWWSGSPCGAIGCRARRWIRGLRS